MIGIDREPIEIDFLIAGGGIAGGKEVEVRASLDQFGMLQQLGVVSPMGPGGG